MAYDEAHGRMVLFGGFDEHGGFFGDTWEWDGTSWTQGAGGPLARSDQAMAYDRIRGRVVLYGGGTYSTKYVETWEWDGNSWSQQATSGPGDRFQHLMAYDTAMGRTILFGGFSGGTKRNDTWTWDGSTWVQLAVGGPPVRSGNAMAYDSDRAVVVLHSWDGNGTLPGTWEFDGTAWMQRSANGPDPSIAESYGTSGYARGMTYDLSSHRTVLVAQANGAQHTWLWDGTSWAESGAAEPPVQYKPATAYDSTRGRTVMLDEQGGTWEFASAPASACCNPDGTCASLTSTACTAAGGVWNSGVLCPNASCAPAAACCRPDHTCSTLTSAACVSAGGTWFSGTTCAGSSPCCLATFTQQPASVAVLPGGTAHLSVAVQSTGGAYQWRRNGVNLANAPYPTGCVMTGADTPTLTISYTQSADNGTAYDCVVTTACGSVRSDPAGLGVVIPCYANCDGSTLAPILNVGDFTCFLQKYAAGCP
jgi:hypothetical protein